MTTDDVADQPTHSAFSRSHLNTTVNILNQESIPLKIEDDKDSLLMFSIEDAIESMGFGVFQGLVLVYAGMAWVADAMEMMLLSFIGPALQRTWNLSATQESMITSVVFIGMMFGAYFWGALSDLHGRRSGFFFTAILTFGAGLLSALSPNYHMLLFLRSVVGVGLAGGAVVTSWFLEFIPTSNRGIWMVVISLFWTVGTMAEAILAWVIMPTLGWRWLLGFSSVPLLFLLLFYPFIPESPRYLMTQGKASEALGVLRKISQINQIPLPCGQLIQESVRTIEEGRSRQIAHEAIQLIKSLFSPSMIRSTLLIWLVFFANAFTYYGLVLLTSQLTGGMNSCDSAINTSQMVHESDLYEGALVTSFAELPGLLVSAVIVDRIGRKKSMSGLFLLCGTCLLPLVGHLDRTGTTLLLFIARACITGTFTIVYIYAPEVYPTQLRATGLGVANSFARIGGILCPLVAVELVRSCQVQLAVSLFVAVAIMGAIAVILLPIETKGRSLTDTVEELRSI